MTETVSTSVIQKAGGRERFLFISCLMAACENESGNVARPKPLLSQHLITARANADVLGLTRDDKVRNHAQDYDTNSWSAF
jgi:hypothetical protein